MENLGVVCSSQKLVLGCSSPNSRIPGNNSINFPKNKPLFGKLFGIPERKIHIGGPTKASFASVSAHYSRPRFNTKAHVLEKQGMACFARITSSGGQQTSSVGVNPPLSVPPPPSHVGSPLFWVGVGVGLSALFSWVATNLKKYAMQQAFKSMMGQMDSQNNQFTNAAFSPGSPFPFPTPPMPNTTASPSTPFPFPTPPIQGTAASPSAPASQQVVTLDVPPTKVEAPPATTVEDDLSVEEPKKYAFVDVSPDETLKTKPIESFKESAETDSPKDHQFANQTSQNGAASKPRNGAFEGSSTTQQGNHALSVEALEKMMEDPTVQKMVYPYLPEELRNPTTFKWMLQNPEYRQQLQDMLNNSMGGTPEWDNRMMDSLKNFDLSSPEVKQQFDQIGLTPEEVISKIMANPDVAMAFQNPRVQAAIMDCSQNPLSIAKYQNDKEVMDVFNKISELFPGVTGSP